MISEREKTWVWDLIVILGEGDWDGLLGLALWVYIYIYSLISNSIIRCEEQKIEEEQRSCSSCV